MAEARDFSLFARSDADGTVTMEFAVDGVACGGCISRIEGAMAQLAGVTDARLNFTNRRLTLAWKRRSFDPAVAIDALERMGYRAHPFRADDSEEEEARQARWLLRCLGVSGFAAMNIMLLSVSVWSGNVTDITPEIRDLFHWISALIALPAAAYAGQPFFRSAWHALSARSVNMDVPISLGIVLALGMSLVETAGHAAHAYFDSAIMLIFFLLCGRYLDYAMRRRTRAVAGNLAALKAETAHKFLDSGELVQVPIAALRANDRILVRAGERISADGVMVGGHTSIDESLITGETMPRDVVSGAMVYAGSINLHGTLTLRVTAAGENTLLDEIDRLLDKAVKTKSRYVRLADRAASYYAPIVHSAAALTLIGWLLSGATIHNSVLAAISVLIITCPCALALAIPVVQVVTAGRLFRSGIFLNSGDAIERLAEIDTVIFDKTGTLTLPEPRVINASAIDPAFLQMAGRLALSSLHPLARAIAASAKTLTPFAGTSEDQGQGVRAVVDGCEMRFGSPIYCGMADDPALGEAERLGASAVAFRHGERKVILLIHQTLRPDAVSVVRHLTSLGLDVRILSGDRPSAVAQIAETIAVKDWQGGFKPADKVAMLEELKLRGRRVLMVGDGINDAPSLAAAHVSMSPISAADLSRSQADTVFLGEPLAPVHDAIVTARQARRLMAQNLGFAAIYNLVAVPIAVAGLATPLIAALAMSGSSVLVTLNALRVRQRSTPVDRFDVPAAATIIQPRPA